MTQGNVQLGKGGVTENFIVTLKHHFNRHNNVKVSVLKSAGRERETVKRHANEIIEKLGDKHYTAKIIGFSIFVKRWRKEVR